MFTVLVRDDRGAESLYAAKTVGRCPTRGEYSIPPMGAVEIVLEDEEMVPGGKIVLEPPAGDNSDGFAPMVFVMNKHGATVATYRL